VRATGTQLFNAMLTGECYEPKQQAPFRRLFLAHLSHVRCFKALLEPAPRSTYKGAPSSHEKLIDLISTEAETLRRCVRYATMKKDPKRIALLDDIIDHPSDDGEDCDPDAEYDLRNDGTAVDADDVEGMERSAPEEDKDSEATHLLVLLELRGFLGLEASIPVMQLMSTFVCGTTLPFGGIETPGRDKYVALLRNLDDTFGKDEDGHVYTCDETEYTAEAQADDGVTGKFIGYDNKEELQMSFLLSSVKAAAVATMKPRRAPSRRIVPNSDIVVPLLAAMEKDGAFADATPAVAVTAVSFPIDALLDDEF